MGGGWKIITQPSWMCMHLQLGYTKILSHYNFDLIASWIIGAMDNNEYLWKGLHYFCKL
jgi:hypothetical protein